MGLFDIFRGSEVALDDAVAQCQSDPRTLLIDVRSHDEYTTGHVPGSINVPATEVARIAKLVKDKDAHVFLYCRSGARARSVKRALEKMGYTNVKNAGGIGKYSGKLKV